LTKITFVLHHVFVPNVNNRWVPILGVTKFSLFRKRTVNPYLIVLYSILMSGYFVVGSWSGNYASFLQSYSRGGSRISSSGGGAHFKKLRRAEGGAKFFGIFRVKKRDFTPKNHIFSNFRGGVRRVRPPLDPHLYSVTVFKKQPRVYIWSYVVDTHRINIRIRIRNTLLKKAQSLNIKVDKDYEIVPVTLPVTFSVCCRLCQANHFFNGSSSIIEA
jgi:hypothetical protein